MNIANWVRQNTSTIGVGALVLTDVVQSFIRFSAVFANNDKVFYSIIDGNDRENGLGTYIAAGNTITRDVIFETLVNGAYTSSNPTAISLTGSAVVSVMPTTKGLLTHDSTWNTLYPTNITPTVGYTAPGNATITGNIQTPVFDSSVVESLGMIFVIPNDIQPNSYLYPVIHWDPTTTNAGTVRWGIEYTKANVAADSFTSVNTLYVEQASSLVIGKHQAIEFADVDKIPSSDPESVILMRVFRDASHVNDTYASDVGLLTVGLRYQSTMLGSPKRSGNYYDWIA